MTHYINPKLSDRQYQIIKGTILGGSSIVRPNGGKNCYLSMRNKDGFWLDYKSSELMDLSSRTPVTIEKTNRWHSLCYPVFSEIHELFYKGKDRNLSCENLDKLQLKDIAFMVWFMDAGKHEKNVITLNTHIWGEKGSEAIVDYFNLCGYNSEIFQERKNYRVRLDSASTVQFLKMIAPLYPSYFSRKI